MNMKHKSWIFLLAFAGLLLFSCHNKNKNTPESAAEQFEKAFVTADFPHLYEFASKKSQILVKTMQNNMKNRPEKQEEMSKNEVEILGVEIVEQSDSTAKCICNIKLNGQTRKDTWDLVKEDNLWKVTLVMP